MMKLIQYIFIMFSGTLLFSQNVDKELVKGNWILTGIKELPYNNDHDIFQTSDVSLDSVLTLKIGENRLTIIESLIKQPFYSKIDTSYYDYIIETDSTGRLNLNFNQGTKRGLRRKYKHCSDFQNYEIIKINNSMLSIEKREIEPSSLFFRYSITRYYFKKILDSLTVNEFNFYGKWFVKEKIEDLSLMDTIVLIKDSAKIHYLGSEIEITLEFKQVIDDEDSYYFATEIHDEIMGSWHLKKGIWFIDSDKNIIVLKSENNEIIKFLYKLEKNMIILIKHRS